MSKRASSLLLLICLAFSLSSCSSQFSTKITPANLQIQDADILIEYNGNVYFLNSDGENLGNMQVIRNCKFRLFCDERVFLNSVTWNQYNGSVMGSIWEQGPGNLPLIEIDNQGQVFGCVEEHSLLDSERNRALSPNTVLAITITDDMHYELVQYNTQKCEIEKNLYTKINADPIVEVDVSREKWIAVYTGHSIEVYNSYSEKVFSIDSGYCPLWSRDGQYLLAVKNQVMYIYTKDGELIKRLQNTNRCPSWSPNAQSIIYSDDSGIYILDLSSTQIAELSIFEDLKIGNDTEGNFDWK